MGKSFHNPTIHTSILDVYNVNFIHLPIAAIALDAGLDTVDRIFGAVLFGDCPKIHKVWVQIPKHPLQEQCPDGDRNWTTKVPMLKVRILSTLNLSTLALIAVATR